jgi:circadian clock protein KaiB
MPVEKISSKTRQRKSVAQDTTAAFEELLSQTDAIQRYQLRLYITGSSARSSQAIANIRALCEEYLPGRYDLEVIDIYQQPGQAVSQQIIAAPTLIKELPVPPRRIIGNLSDRKKVIVGLNLKAAESNPKALARKTKWAKV